MNIEDEFLDINDKYEITYKGVNLGITLETIQDYKFQTGQDPKQWIQDLYNNSLTVLRDEKLSDLLRDE